MNVQQKSDGRGDKRLESTRAIPSLKEHESSADVNILAIAEEWVESEGTILLCKIVLDVEFHEHLFEHGNEMIKFSIKS